MVEHSLCWFEAAEHEAELAHGYRLAVGTGFDAV